MDCYAITFDSPYMNNPDLKDNFTSISIDPLQPSDLLHVRMLISGVGYGNVLFPSYIPGIDNVYYNFENENFSGGVDISATNIEVNYPDPDPDPVGSLEWKSFTGG